MTDLEFVVRVLTLVNDFDGANTDNLFWRTGGEYAPVKFFVICNDMFWWGTADLEPITPDNIDQLELAHTDMMAVDKIEASIHSTDLFCCRMRKTRPQGAYYDHLNEKLWPLFDAVGPLRAVDFANPKKHPSERTTT